MAQGQLEILTTTPEERRERLLVLEGVVKRGKEVFLEVGRALEEIREGELYRPDYEDFGLYCEKTFDIDRRRANRYIAWARADEALGPIGLHIENEAQAREMYPIVSMPEVAREVWETVGRENGGSHPSKALREEIGRRLGVRQGQIEEAPGAPGDVPSGDPGGFSDVHFARASDEWTSPAHIVERARLALGGEIDLDPSAEEGRGVKAKSYFTQGDDGLSKEWGGRVFLNPPYSEALKWVRKLVEEYRAGRTTAAVALLPARTDTEWYGLLRGFARCFITGRLKFGGSENSAPFPSVAVYLGKEASTFVEAFGDVGEVYVGWREDIDPYLEKAEGSNLPASEIGQAIGGYTDVRTGEHGEYVDPDIMRRTTNNRGRRLHNEDDARKRIDALPNVEETGIDGIEILKGEFQKVLAPRLADGSVDMVLTDPPYSSGPDTRRLWDELGAFSKRVLKPDGFLVSYMGTDDTAEELERVRKSVPWWWQIIVTHDESDTSHDKMFSRNYKPINVFGRVADRLKRRGKTLVSLREGEGRDKSYHEWGQPVEEAIRLIQELTEPGELVVDPFVGGGTTAVAAMKTGRRCLAAEKNERHHRVAIDRVITESNTRGYGYEFDPEGDALRRAEPRSERVRRALTGLPPSFLVLRPRDISEAS